MIVTPVVFDPTISLGNLITIGGAALMGLGFLYSLEKKIALLAERLRSFEEMFKTVHERFAKIETSFDHMGIMATRLAVQEQRIGEQDKRFGEWSARLADLERATTRAPPRTRKRGG